MLEQIITERDVRQLIHKHELYQEKGDSDFVDFNEIIKGIYANISSSNFNFNINKTYLYDKPLYLAGNIETKIVLRYLDKLVKRIYKVKQANRDRIIKQLISILQSTNEFYIIKLDISSFYESIDTTKLIQRLRDDGIISFQNVSYIESVINKTSGNGLPRGIPFSASLSELYLRDLDKYLKSNTNVSYFARYVDDIIIISSEDISKDVSFYVVNNLSLVLNKSKMKIRPIKNTETGIKDFEFLGYNFKVTSKVRERKDKSRDLTISISQSKIEKIKRRIVKAALIFIQNKNFDSFYDRLRLIFSNYQLDSNANGILMTGIYYNYKYITDNSSLNKINQFKNYLITSNSRLSKRIKVHLTSEQKEKLLKLNICSGFNSKMKIKFSAQKIQELCKVLKYV
ncbi:MAG: reverse transcriptase domain-containing protein [Spirochaetales bacterium]|nr:reverse transcriptase domain-containing protein [Spirochaetales bacterium]